MNILRKDERRLLWFYVILTTFVYIFCFPSLNINEKIYGLAYLLISSVLIFRLMNQGSEQCGSFTCQKITSLEWILYNMCFVLIMTTFQRAFSYKTMWPVCIFIFFICVASLLHNREEFAWFCGAISMIFLLSIIFE